MFLKDLNKFNSDFLDGRHAGNSANSVPVLNASAKLPLAQIPTGTTKDTVSLGNHTHSYAGSNSVGGAAKSALACTGNSVTATSLETPRNINGTAFDGSTNITTANWGTSRTIKIGNTGKSVNGSGNYTWTLSEIGALSAAGGTMTGGLDFPNGSGNAIDLTTTGGNVVNGLCISNQNNVVVGNSTCNTIITSYSNPKTTIGSNTYTIYHTGNKPTAADVGALSTAGGETTGNITSKGNLIANGYVWAKSGVAYLGDKDYFNCYNNEMQLFLNGSLIFSVAPDGDVMSKGSITSEDYLWSKNGHLYLGETDYFQCSNHSMSLVLNGQLNTTINSEGITSNGRITSTGSVTCNEYMWAKNGYLYLRGEADYLCNSGNDFTFYKNGDWKTSLVYAGAFTAYDHITINDHKIFVQVSAPSNPSDGDIWIQI